MKAVRIAGIMLVIDEWWLFAWKPADPVLGTHPQHAFSVLKYRFDGVIVQAVRIGWLCCIEQPGCADG